MADIIKSYNDVARRNVDMLDGTYSEVITSVSKNITNKFRDAFEDFDPINGGKWSEVRASGDLVYVDGNAAGASYLVISKDPLTAGTQTDITSSMLSNLPVEVALGISMSQRTLGQEFAIEVVDNQPVSDPAADIAISSISQATTVLTILTVADHGLSVGSCIGVYGCSDPVANYPSLVVASVPDPRQITCTAGPGGTIPSRTTANPAGAKGSIYIRERLGRANDGLSQIFENSTATNASLYLRSESGDALPSGTIVGSHSVTIGTTASVQLVNSAYQYAFSPTTEYRLFIQSDRTQWADNAVDAISQTSSRLLRTQVCPDPDKQYRLRIRAVNNKALTVPNAEIVTAVKSGTTTATITTATPHGLSTLDVVTIYGIRDQAATSFPNLLVATSVASVINATSFTIIIGSAGTATSYGGYVARVNGANLPSALGHSAIIIQSAVLTTLTNGIRQLTLTGNTNWASLSIGDLVNVYGCRNIVDGASIGVDGAWKVANIVTTSLKLVLPYDASMVLPSDFGSVNCGGGVIKRTDIRLSFARIFAYERERVEMLSRPANDISSAAPVVIQGGTLPAITTVSTVSTVTALTGGGAAEDAAAGTNPVTVGGVVRTASSPTTLVAGDAARATMTSSASIVTYPYAVPEVSWSYAAAASGIVNTTTAVTIKTAAAAGIRNYITDIEIMSEALTNATELSIRDGAAGTTLWRTKIPTGGLITSHFSFATPLRGTAATLLEVVTLTASGAGAVYFNAQGFTGA